MGCIYIEDTGVGEAVYGIECRSVYKVNIADASRLSTIQGDRSFVQTSLAEPPPR